MSLKRARDPSTGKPSAAKTTLPPFDLSREFVAVKKGLDSVRWG